MCDGRILDKGAVDKISGYFEMNCLPCDHLNVPTARGGDATGMTDVATATARALLDSLGGLGGHITGEDVAHLEVHGNEVVGAHLVPGLDIDVEQLDDGVEAHIRLHEGVQPRTSQSISASACCPKKACSTSS